MTDAELYKATDALRGYYPEDDDVMALCTYVTRYTDPTPLAECLERVAGERGGKISGRNIRFATFPAAQLEVSVRFDGWAELVDHEGDVANMPTITTAGELHRLLDTMGVSRG